MVCFEVFVYGVWSFCADSPDIEYGRWKARTIRILTCFLCSISRIKNAKRLWKSGSSYGVALSLTLITGRKTANQINPGASGSGRTTFVNTLTEQPLLPHRSQSLLTDPTNPGSPLDPQLVAQVAAEAHIEQGILIKPVNVELEEDGVRIALTIVDTPGFGDGIDNEFW